ncbi:hypothetical protein [Pseudomonas sp. GD03944]|uniref:hypothetical protein n=1 Tax=Pseudomonas sp. GD03944 TaxID=2975409 RepID=UPI00244930F1|nr:hypothetical protein [Pseudomonas sp. GD03944]MDH1262929.1 hypothetical protein [Pseudomonas sp. GD03944]
MRKTIKADFLLTPIGYNSFSEALSASAQKNSAHSKEVEINGRIVCNYAFNGKSLAIEFDNHKYLLIYPGKNSVNWDVVEKKPFIESLHHGCDLLFDIKGKLFDLEWTKILNGFIGKQVAISLSDQYLFIFSKNGVEYMINIIFDVENQEEKFLFISEA